MGSVPLPDQLSGTTMVQAYQRGAQGERLRHGDGTLIMERGVKDHPRAGDPGKQLSPGELPSKLTWSATPHRWDALTIDSRSSPSP
jgi:hypothetical protein